MEADTHVHREGEGPSNKDQLLHAPEFLQTAENKQN